MKSVFALLNQNPFQLKLYSVQINISCSNHAYIFDNLSFRSIDYLASVAFMVDMDFSIQYYQNKFYEKLLKACLQQEDCTNKIILAHFIVQQQ